VINDKEHPCLKRLDADCFKHDPEFFKRAFALRLLFLLTRGLLSRLLPQMPEGLIPPIIDPDDNPIPPIYIPPWTPGPIGGIGGISPPGQEIEITITASTADGYIYSDELTWTAARNNPALPGISITRTRHNLAMSGYKQIGRYYVRRSFLYFDLSSLPTGKKIVNAIVGVVGYSNALTQVSIQKGTQGEPLETSDWNAFSGSPFSILTWQKYVDPDLNTNLFELDGPGRSYIRQKLGTTAKFCMREYTKDYLNVEPTSSPFMNGMHYANNATAALRPYITIIYK